MTRDAFITWRPLLGERPGKQDCPTPDLTNPSRPSSQAFLMPGFLAPQQLGASLLRPMEPGRRKSHPMAFGNKRMRKKDPGHEIQQEVATVGGRESGAQMHRFAAGCGWT